MKLIYSPEGADPREWDVKIPRLDVDDVVDIETKTGLLFRDWQAAVLNGGAKATKALLWVLLRRDNKTLRYEQVQFAVGDVEFDFDDDELRAYVDLFDQQIAEDGLDLPPSALRELDEMRARVYPTGAPGEGDAAEDAGPKASRSRKSSAATSPTSPST